MSICKDTIKTISTSITCANICAPNIQSFAIDYQYNAQTFSLTGDDGFDSDDYQHAWELKNNNKVIITTGFGYFNDIVPLFSNGSTFGNIFLGQNNNEICDFIRQQGFFVGNNIFEVIYNVKRLSDGVIIKKTKYNFSK